MLAIFAFSAITGAFPHVSFLVSIMASLNAWLVASTGRLPPVEQAKLWALREGRPKFAVSNKKLLQSHVDGARLGQSATQLFAYEVFLWRTPIMLTTNNWKYDDYTDSDKNWLDANCVAVHIQEKVFEIGSFV